MNLQYFCISAMCQYEDAAVYGITKLKVDDFTDIHKKLYKITTGLFKLKRRVDLHVFVSQAQSVGLKEGEANMIYHYCLDHDDDWEHAFQELKRLSIDRTIGSHLNELLELKSEQKSPALISSRAMRYAADWVTEGEKRYYSGKEIDEMEEEYGDPILTGYPLYDDKIYAYGGNLKGQMKGVIMREKHGKTRSECWEVAQNIRMGHKVLYLALEGRKQDITGNIKQVLQHQWQEYRENLYVVDGVVDLDELETIVVEAVMVDGVEKVVVDYMQLVVPSGRFSGENERINEATERFRHLMVKHNFHCTALNQARKANPNASAPKDADGNLTMPSGYKYVPSAYEAYGSNALIKAATLILVGFRPNQYEELTKVTGLSTKVIDPNHQNASYYSLFMKIERTRYKPEYLHKWWQFTDSDEGLNLMSFIQ